ncbi:MAG: HNH endonuclease [Congregibacter sp.]
MWNESPHELTSRYAISSGQAQHLQCTGEHLERHSTGGSSGSKNIVAACLYCNQTRHKRNIDLPPVSYKKHVRNRLSKGAWHGLILTT